MELNEEQYVFRLQSIRRARLRRVILLIPLIIGVALYWLRELLYFNWSISPTYTAIVAITLIGVGTASFLLQYLRGASPYFYFPTQGDAQAGEPYSLTAHRQIRHLEVLQDALERRVSALGQSKAGITLEEKSALVRELREATSEGLLDLLVKKYGDQVSEQAKIDRVHKTFDEARFRLHREIGSLSRRGNLNLVIGAMTTALAVWLLYYMISGADKPFTNLTELLSYYIPRVTIALFIEVFAFFFLRLYKWSLSEIKYYQDELTKQCSRAIAFESIASDLCSATASDVIRQIASTGMAESTTDVEKTGMDSKQVKAASELVDKIANLISSLSGKK